MSCQWNRGNSFRDVCTLVHHLVQNRCCSLAFFFKKKDVLQLLGNSRSFFMIYLHEFISHAFLLKKGLNEVNLLIFSALVLALNSKTYIGEAIEFALVSIDWL
jgi:hypothetical protein